MELKLKKKKKEERRKEREEAKVHAAEVNTRRGED